MLQLYLDNLAAGMPEFFATEKQLIGSVAAECPLYGGRGVYVARALQSRFRQSVDYSDTDECAMTEESSRPEAAERNEAEVVSAKIWPNPASDFIRLELIGYFGKDALLSITDVAGKPVLNRVLPFGTKTYLVQVQDFAPGIYFAQVRDGDSAIFSGKIIVNK